MDEVKNIENNAPIEQQNISDHNININVHVTDNHADKYTHPNSPGQPWNIPYLRNDYFTGREEILEQPHARFKTNHATALSQRHAMSGLGGVGKTQIAELRCSKSADGSLMIIPNQWQQRGHYRFSESRKRTQRRRICCVSVRFWLRCYS
jgi:hypothetical protein